MSVVNSIKSSKKTAFSFELLPPLKGNGIDGVNRTIDALREFDPKYINITTHRSEMVFKQTENGLFEQVSERHRPGTVAIAAAIQNTYKIPVVPHIICSGFTREETEYALIDLQYLGITDLLLLRGDKAKHEKQFMATGNAFATELQEQVNRYNQGFFLDGSSMKATATPFSYGMACYPEKHEEAPNMATELKYAKQKVDAGAEYLVTQMFFDNKKYFAFVNDCRAIGINVPIIPGLKAISTRSQLHVIPQTFKVDIPEELSREVEKCTTPKAVRELGIEWAIKQSRELYNAGVPIIHYFTMGKADNMVDIVRAVL